ncbi:MAG: methylmalonyl-CoA epimerase [Miltoncostaeaceae bacterium]
MTLGPVHHMGHVVPDLDEAIASWRDRFGLRVTIREELPEQLVEAAMLEAEGARVELIAPTSAESGVARYLDKRGPGMHHIAFEVPDVAAALAHYRDDGAELIDEAPRAGLGGHMVAFLHPSSAHGVLVELVESG